MNSCDPELCFCVYCLGAVEVTPGPLESDALTARESADSVPE